MRLLIIAYHFPPDGAVGALRPYHLARLLPEHGIEAWVLTVHPNYAERLDPSMQIGEELAQKVIRTHVLPSKRDRYLALKQFFVQRQATGMNDLLRGDVVGGTAVQAEAKPLWRRWIAAWLSFPDWYAGWRKPAIRSARELMRNYPFDAVLSTSPPRIVHLIARDIAREFRLAWVMDMRDPWTVVEWQGESVRLWPFKGWYERLLRSCLQQASCVTLNTGALHRYMAECYPIYRHKMSTLPNGIDERWVSLSENDASHSAHLLIGHFGSLHGRRNIHVFLRGLSRWLERHPEARLRLRVGLWGAIERGETLEQIGTLNLQDVVQSRGVIPRSEAIAHMQQCYLLVLVATEQPLQVPAKVYEYLAAGRRILALTERGGATAELLGGHPGCLIVENEQEVMQALDQCWRDYTAGVPAFISYETLIRQYAYSEIAGQLADLLKHSCRHVE